MARVWSVGLAAVVIGGPATALTVAQSKRDVFANQTATTFTFSNSEISFDFEAPGETVRSAVVMRPDGGSIPLTATGSQAQFSTYPPSEAAMTAAFPGGTYVYSAVLASGETRQIAVDDDLSIHPADFPRITNFATLTTADVAHDFVVDATAFTDPYASGGYFIVFDSHNGQVVRDDSLADLAAGRFVVPAGTLTAGASYGFQLGWFDLTYYHHAADTDSYAYQFLRYSTAGLFTLAAAPSSTVPEPTAWGTMLAGFATIGALLRRRTAPRAG